MTVAAIDRAITVLECLAGQPDGVELGVLAGQLKLPKSATHRILATLVRRGWVQQDPATQAYALSLRIAMLAFRDLDARVATDAVQPILDDLARRTREYVRLAVVDGETITWVGRAQGAVAGLRYDPDMGNEVVLHTTATGKAWLASLAEEEALRIVAAQCLGGKLVGPNAARTLDDVRQRLAETRERGYGIVEGEAEPGIVALAVAFRRTPDPDAPVAGTISVAGPAARMGPERHAHLLAALEAAAHEIEAVWTVRERGRGNERRVA